MFLLEGEQVGTHVFDLGEHLVSEPVDGLDFLPLLVGQFPGLVFLLALDSGFETGVLVVHFVPFAHVQVVLLELGLELADLVLGDPAVVFELPVLHIFQILCIHHKVLIYLSRSLILFSRVILLTSRS